MKPKILVTGATGPRPGPPWSPNSADTTGRSARWSAVKTPVAATLEGLERRS